MSYLEDQRQKEVLASDRVTMRKWKLITRYVPVTRSLLRRDLSGLGNSEPYYQLMRQTLLAHEIIKANELKSVNTAEG